MTYAGESTAKLGSLAASSSRIGSSSSYSGLSRLLPDRPQREFVSVQNCSKLCAVCFVAGIFVGYTLKRRLNRLASKLLRRLRDD